MRHRSWLWYGMVASLLSGCVTINIYFPAAAAQKAADRIIQGVYGAGSAPAPAPAPQPGAAPAKPQGLRSVPSGGPLLALMNLLVPAAHAAADLNVQSPTIRGIRASLEARHPALAPFYDSGAIGMTQGGLLTVRNLGAVPLSQRNRVQQLVAQDNQDRNALYQAIAAANGHPEWEADVRKVFAQRWIANAPSGWWYQAADGSWKRK